MPTDLQIRSKTALSKAITAAVGAGFISLKGFPVSIGGKGLTAVFDPSWTAAQITSANSIVSAWDWADSAQAARGLTDSKNSSTSEFGTASNLAILTRSAASTLVSEINAIRDWITSFKAAVAASTSFANLQTRIAALAAMPDRTLAQAKAAILSAISTDTGS